MARQPALIDIAQGFVEGRQEARRAEEAPLRNRLLDLQAQQLQMEELTAFAPVLRNEMFRISEFPLEQRQAAAEQSKSRLSQMGVSEGLLANFDTTDLSDQTLNAATLAMNDFVKSSEKREETRDTRTKEEKNLALIDRVTREVGEGTRSQEELDALKAEMGYQTAEERAEAERTVTAAKKGEELRQKRISGIREELGERSRSAIRSSATVREALQAASKADQGITGALKLQLGRLFPGIDTSDEAALDSALKDLAVQQLQNFKGPTTDFEFVQVQNITGRLSDGRSANEARIASLDRAQWFMQQELAQFDRYIATGGDPDKWEGFNYDEEIQTSAGPITMRDLRDTAAANHITIDETLRRLNR